MPTIQIEGREAVTAEAGQKLVLALEDGGVDVLHRCGGNARCTTCAVEVRIWPCRRDGRGRSDGPP